VRSQEEYNPLQGGRTSRKTWSGEKKVQGAEKVTKSWMQVGHTAAGEIRKGKRKEESSGESDELPP